MHKQYTIKQQAYKLIVCETKIISHTNDQNQGSIWTP
jgi:hypothetical protein